MSTEDHDAAQAVHRATQALNDAIGEAVGAGYRVEVDTMEVTEMGDRHPVHYVSVAVLKNIKPSPMTHPPRCTRCLRPPPIRHLDGPRVDTITWECCGTIMVIRVEDLERDRKLHLTPDTDAA